MIQQVKKKLEFAISILYFRLQLTSILGGIDEKLAKSILSTVGGNVERAVQDVLEKGIEYFLSNQTTSNKNEKKKKGKKKKKEIERKRENSYTNYCMCSAFFCI